MLTSPGERPNAPELISRLIGNGPVGILLARNGVYWLHEAAQRERLTNMGSHLFALTADLEARGLDLGPEGVEQVSETKMVELIMERYQRSVTL